MICGSPFAAVSKSTGGGGVFGVGVTVGVIVAVGLSVGVGVNVRVGVKVGLGVEVGVAVGVGVGVAVGVGVCVGVGVNVRVGVIVGLGVEVGVAVGVGVDVEVRVGVMVAVGVGVSVGTSAHTLGVPEHEYPSSTAHTDEHPSVLVEFPSSHSSKRPVWIWPPYTTAASFVPSEEEVMDHQTRLLSRGVQVSPLSVEV
jgi:hypothetical protein